MYSILPFDNVLNVRRFGAAHLVENHLYRGAQLSAMSDSDRSQFAGFDISLVIDFRYHSERQRQPSALQAPFMPNVIEILSEYDQIGGTELAPHEAFMRNELETADDARRYMMNSYFERATHEAFICVASRALKRMSETGEPIYVHCAAGKDRTGTFVALLLMLLGVSDEDVMVDYLRTREALEFDAIKVMAAKTMEKRFGRPYDPDALEPFFGVSPEYLTTSLDVIGDPECYVKKTLGLSQEDIQSLRKHYQK